MPRKQDRQQKNTMLGLQTRKHYYFVDPVPPCPEIKTDLTALFHPAGATIKALQHIKALRLSKYFQGSRGGTPNQQNMQQSQSHSAPTKEQPGLQQCGLSHSLTEHFCLRLFFPPPPQKFKIQLHSFIGNQTTLWRKAQDGVCPVKYSHSAFNTAN